MESMEKTFIRKAVACAAVCASLMGLGSCVNEQYEISEESLDLNVGVFQEGISIPLGSTDKITLESLYSQLDEETKKMLQEINGAYTFRMADSMDMTKDVADALGGIGGIDAVSLTNQTFEFPIENIDLSGISIKGQTVGPKTIDVSAMVDVPDFADKLPKIELTLDPITVSVPEVPAQNLKIDLSSVEENMSNVTDIVKAINIPEEALKMSGVDLGKEMTVSEINSMLKQIPGELSLETSFSFEAFDIKVPLKFSLPKQIKSVEEVSLHKDAQFELIFEIQNSLFTSGSITPKLDADIHNLIHIDKTESGMEDGMPGVEDADPDHDGIFVQHIHDKFVMNAGNGWKSDHIYHIDALSITPDDWKRGDDDCLTIEKEVTVSMGGELVQPEGLKTTLHHLIEQGKNPMKLKMMMKFNNFEIANVAMAIDPVIKTQTLSQNIEINLSGLPELVESIKYVELDENNPLNIKMNAVLPNSCSGMDITLETLTLNFPDGMVVNHKDFKNGTLTLSNVSLTEGLDENIEISKIELPEISDGALLYKGNIEVEAKAVASGTLHSNNLINAPAQEVSISGSVKYEPVLKDYCVEIDDYKYDVSSAIGTFDPINVKLDKSVGEMLEGKSISVKPKQGRITITMDYPDHKIINLAPLEGEGLVLDFPDMLEFTKETYDAYKISTTDNKMAFTGDAVIPKLIELDIEKINVSAIKENDEYYLRDEIKVTGGVRLKGTEIHMEDIGNLKNEDLKITFGVDIPTIEPAEFKMDEYEISLEKVITIDPIEVELPDMVTSLAVDELLLKDVYLDLEVNAASLKEIIGNDASVQMQIKVDLPEIFMVKSTDESKAEVDKDNKLSVHAELDEKGKIVVDCINIVGLDLSSVKAQDGKLSLNVDDIPVSASVKLADLTVNVDALKGKTLSATLNGGLASRDADLKPTTSIEIDKIKGKVALGIDPVEMSVDLSEIKQTLISDEMSVNVDINTFYLVLNVNTNIDVPLKGSLEVTPYYGNVPGANKGSVNLELDPQTRKDDMYNIFVSNMTPEESGGRYDLYKDYMCSKLDLVGLLYNRETGQMADSLAISLNAGVDPDKICTIEPSKEYVLKADYEVGVPLELGKDFAFEYHTVIKDLTELASQVFSYGSVGLGGSVTNGLPLNLNFWVYPLDSQGERIPLKEGVGHMKIASCDAKGKPVTTKIDFVLSGAGADLSDMKAVELVFRADAKDAAGVPLNAESFIQVDLNARIPEGVTVDLKELMQSENEEN